MKDKIAILEISSWAGISIGATHCYGDVWIQGEKIELQKVLTKEEAEIKTNIDEGYRWKAGDTTGGFDSEKEIRIIAINICKKNPSVKLLLEGTYCVADVQKAIYGDPKIISKINKLYKKADKIGFWDHREHESEMEDIDNKFDSLLEEIRGNNE